MRAKYFVWVLVGMPIGCFVVDRVGYIAEVEGSSMQPTLNPDPRKSDYVFLNRWATRKNEFHRGEIVSLLSPKKSNEVLIKRVIGLSGDTVYTHGYKEGVLEVPEGHCWVEGDNTRISKDSNTFGPVPLGLVTAKATHIVWPPSRWQTLYPSTAKSIIQRNRTSQVLH